jgi:predicted ATPase
MQAGLGLVEHHQLGRAPDLLAPLAALIARAAEGTQVLVVSHAAALVAALETISSGGRGDRSAAASRM